MDVGALYDEQIGSVDSDAAHDQWRRAARSERLLDAECTAYGLIPGRKEPQRVFDLHPPVGSKDHLREMARGVSGRNSGERIKLALSMMASANEWSSCSSRSNITTVTRRMCDPRIS